jgi:spermidine synthase
VLSQIAQKTVYTFAILLAVYLIGTALGAAVYQRRRSSSRPGEAADHTLLLLLALSCLVGIVGMGAAETVKTAVLQMLPSSLVAALAAEAVVAMAAMLLPSAVMGALFSHLAVSARAHGLTFGRALAANTLGAAAAPVLFGVVIVPLVGTKLALLGVAAGYAVLYAWRSAPARNIWPVGAAIVGFALWAPSLNFVDVPEGGRIVSLKEGALATVSVVEDSHGVARLHIDNGEQEGSSASLLADARQALLPLLLHPSPQRALFLGLGTGVTASAGAGDPTVEVDVVELLPEVIEASAYFRKKFEESGPRPRLHIINGDARRFVRAAQTRYDLIVADNYHPARNGSGSLYTVEHFEAIRERLAAGGIFCQWLPLHQLDLESFRIIVRTFMSVYPQTWAMIATNSLETPVVGLISRSDAGRFDARDVRTRLATLRMPRNPTEFGIADTLAIFGSFIAGSRELARFAGNAALNTDDQPTVAYRAPRLAYMRDSLPRDRLLALLREVSVAPEEVISFSDTAWEERRLAAYWEARNRFIEAGRHVQPTQEVRRIVSQVREPLLAVLRISPDFRPAYDPLLRIATDLAKVDAMSARALLEDLYATVPSRPEADEALRGLHGR